MALSSCASSGSLSALSTAVWAAALTITSGRTARTVSSSAGGVAKSPHSSVDCEAQRDQLAQRRERALQLPADLAVLAEQQDLHWVRALCVIGCHPVAVGAALHVARPSRRCRGTSCTVLRMPRLEGLGRPPAELALDLARVDRVAAVVARAVGDVA